MELAKQLVREIRQYCEIYSEFSEADVDDIVYTLSHEGTIPFEYRYGASKLVLIPEESEYVIKIPFCGQLIEGDSYYNEETDEWEYDDDYYEQFYGANTDNGWDYCAVEVENYEIAVEEGMEDFFAQTFLYDFVNGHPVYLQKAINIEAEGRTYSNTTQSKVSDISTKHQRTIGSIGWMVDFYDYYGEDALITLILFVKRFSIHDLHRANVGYYKGAPVIFDYAGFDG